MKTKEFNFHINNFEYKIYYYSVPVREAICRKKLIWGLGPNQPDPPSLSTKAYLGPALTENTGHPISAKKNEQRFTPHLLTEESQEKVVVLKMKFEALTIIRSFCLFQIVFLRSK
jgi:hypothetical protein